MNRYSITTDTYGTIYLYYPNIETARLKWKDAIIEPYNDKSYLKYINGIIEKSNLIGYDYKNRPIYKINYSMGNIKIRFSILDNEYIDFCEYQFFPIGQLINPVTWTMSNPKEVWNKFFIIPKYKELSWCCKSKGQKINKPKELKGIKQIDSIPFLKAKCPIYIKDNDLYINHHDYFSSSLKLNDEDIGAPLDVIVPKYCGKIKKKKFIYGDAWGDIVLQNVAWLKFENIIELIKNGYDHNVAVWMRDEVFKNLGFNNNEGGYMEWLNFFERVCKVVKIKVQNDR